MSFKALLAHWKHQLAILVAFELEVSQHQGYLIKCGMSVAYTQEGSASKSGDSLRKMLLIF
jgi:hypothetical protein